MLQEAAGGTTGQIVLTGAIGAAVITGIVEIVKSAIRGRRSPAPLYGHRRGDDPKPAAVGPSFTESDRDLMRKIILETQATNRMLVDLVDTIGDLAAAIREKNK